jgi:hypothetical protein
MKAEEEGRKWIPPAEYAAGKRGGHRGAVAKRNLRAVYDYSSELGAEADQLLEQVLDPEGANDLQRWPNSLGLSAMYKCKNVINAKFSSDKRCAVAVYPRLENAIFTTAGTSVKEEIGSGATGDIHPNSQRHVSLDATDSHQAHWGEPIYFEGSTACLPFPNSESGTLLYPIGFESIGLGTGDISMRFSFAGAFANQLGVFVRLYDGSFNEMFSQSVLTGNTGAATIRIGVADLASSSVYLSITLVDVSAPYAGTCRLVIQADNAGEYRYNLPNHAQHMSVHDIKDARTLVRNANRAFISGQSLLCTAEMSDISNGGMIATARLPSTAVIGEHSEGQFESWYEYLASLPYNSYDGPIKNGAYTWYLPEDETGFFYRNVEAYMNENNPYMAAEFNVANTTEVNVVRIKVCTVVQFTSNSSIYSMAPAEYIREEQKLRYLLSCVHSSYCNSSHRNDIKRHLKAVAGQLGKILRNPATYKTAAKIASTIGSLML